MSPILFERSNDALNVNPDYFHYPLTTDIGLTTHGSDWEWAKTALMALAFFAVIGTAQRLPAAARTFHYIFAVVLLVNTISSFTVASNLGYAAINVEFHRSGDVAGNNREIFWVRYISWFINFPLILLSLFLTSVTPISHLLYTLFLAWIMVVSWLVGALVSSTYKWGYYVFGIIALFGIYYNLFTTGRRYAGGVSLEVSRAFTVGSALISFVLLLYPICWGVSEGGNVIAPDSEAAFYGVLDILSMPVFAAVMLWSHRNIDPALLGFSLREPGTTTQTRKPVASGANTAVNKEENVATTV